MSEQVNEGVLMLKHHKNNIGIETFWDLDDKPNRAIGD